MGRYTLFNDFLFNGNTTHFEVLNEMKDLGIDDDDRLLVPVLFYLGSEWGEKTRRMRQRHRERLLPRESERKLRVFDLHHLIFWTQTTMNAIAIRLIELTLLLRKLRSHNYNIFECCFLATARTDPNFKEAGPPSVAGLLCMAAFSLIAQILLLFIIIYYNMSDITKVTLWRKDWGTIIVTVITTFFFAKLVHVHGREAYNFYAIFRKAVLKVQKALLAINILVNWGLGIVVVVFNFFFLMISKSVNEAILNSLALLFIVEIDDMLRPEWDDAEFDFLFAENLFSSNAWDSGLNVQVDIYSSVSPQDCYLHLLESDDKIHTKATEHDDGLFALTMYWRRSQINYNMVVFLIRGTNGREFFEDINKFGCVKRGTFLVPCDLAGVTKDLVYWSDWLEDAEAGVGHGQEVDEEEDITLEQLKANMIADIKKSV